MIIDFHVHAGSSLFGSELKLDVLLRSMDGLGIEKSVIMPLKPPGYHYEEGNEEVFSWVSGYRERFIGFGRVDPWRKEAAVVEVRRMFSEYNFAGLFLNPLEEHFSLTSPILRPILEVVREYRKPVMISGGHVRVSHPRQIEYIAREYPDITFIATSGGQINICGALMYDAEEMLTRCSNVYLETSGIYRRDFIEQMTSKLGASRVVFGSGTPYFNQEFELARITTAQVSVEDRNMILRGSALSLLSSC